MKKKHRGKSERGNYGKFQTVARAQEIGRGDARVSLHLIAELYMPALKINI